MLMLLSFCPDLHFRRHRQLSSQCGPSLCPFVCHLTHNTNQAPMTYKRLGYDMM